MKEILEILSACKAKGVIITVDVQANLLRVQGNVAALTDEERNRLKLYKDAIIRLLENNSAEQFERIMPAPEQSTYALSSAQLRLWVACQIEGEGLAYVIPSVYRIDGPLQPLVLASAFAAVVERHHSLRTVFTLNEQGEPRQRILPPDQLGFALCEQDLRHHPLPGEVLDAMLDEELRTAFDLGRGPLIRATLYRLGEEHWVLSYPVHHLVSDG